MLSQVVRDCQRGICVSVQHTSTKQDRPVSGAELVYPTFDLRAEMAHETLDRPGGCITEGADRPAFDLFAAEQGIMNKYSLYGKGCLELTKAQGACQFRVGVRDLQRDGSSCSSSMWCPPCMVCIDRKTRVCRTVKMSCTC